MARHADSKKWATGVKDEKGHDIIILLKDAGSFLDDDFAMCWYVYCMCESTGCFPFAGGWAEQPEWIADAVRVLKAECARCDEEDRLAREDENR